MPRPLIATVHVDAMRRNLALARRRSQGQRIWAVVKANAYGHGLLNALQGFADADGLALIEFDGASRLRQSGWQAPILMLEGAFDEHDVDQAMSQQLTLVVHNEEQLRMLELARPSQPFSLCLKVNTGMNRLGFRPQEVASALARLRALPHLMEVICVTHYANADDAEVSLSPRVQNECFNQILGEQKLPGSLANSAATLWQKPLPGDWIRPGIMLYGASPGAGFGPQLGLHPAMSLQSRLIAIQHVKAGEAVGYGSRFVASQEMRVGVVACGYADGYPRSAPDGTPILVEGIRCPMAGRVSMDMITVDLSAAPQARVGSPVELWGKNLSIDEVAQAAGTIGYELMCALAPRVPVQVDGGP